MKVVDDLPYGMTGHRPAFYAEIRDDAHEVEIIVRTMQRAEIATKTIPHRTTVSLYFRTPNKSVRKTIREYDTWEEAEEGHIATLASFRLLGSVEAAVNAIESW